MEILIDNRQNRLPIDPATLVKRARAILNALACPDGELSIVLVEDPEIEKLNRQYLGRPRPTNVIAFPIREGEFADVTPGLLGDVVISVETAAREAEAADMAPEDRFYELLIHGVLHLFGYDHETDEEEARRMEAKSRELLQVVGAI